MTPKERKVIFTLIGVMFLIMVTVIITKSSKNGKSNADAQSKQNSEVQDMSSLMQGVVENNVDGNSTTNSQNDINSETGNNNSNVDNNSENTNVNNNEGSGTNPVIVKMYKELLFTDIKYENENGGNRIVANIRNTGSTNFTSEVAKLTITTSTGEKIEGLITIPSVNVGETSQLEYLLDEDASNITDFNIEEI